MAPKTIFERLRMRTTLLVPLLFLSFGWTVVSLLILSSIVRDQTRADLVSDLQHSVTTFQNLQRERSELLQRESALLADQPRLMALMTSRDRRTIEDGGREFWTVSGSDLFALFDTTGHLQAAYRKGDPLNEEALEHAIQEHLHEGAPVFYLELQGALYEVAVHALILPQSNGEVLGYMANGMAIDRQSAQQVSEAAAAEVAFTAGGDIVTGTLAPQMQQQLQGEMVHLSGRVQEQTIRLDGEDYLTTVVPLDPAKADVPGGLRLMVLKSFREGQQRLSRLNHWVALLGFLAVLAGGMILLAISRSITRPLANLVEGARALGKGDYTYRLSDDGAEEVRELSRAFERMRVEIQRTQKDLLNAERLATIGRMASSISHDLRHYLSAMYANAEFMSNEKLPQSEREELLAEVQAAVHGMTELLDSLLLFTQTGRALHPEFESMALMLQRSVGMLRAHPTARDVKISLQGLSSLVAFVDGKKLGRAVYNLLLNGCQAANRGKVAPPAVTLTLAEDESFIRIHVADTGPGVPDSVRRTMFLPFVSEGKENGVGLGLTLAEQVAAEHGGYIHYGKTVDNLTLFSIVLPKSALKPPGMKSVESMSAAAPVETVL